MTYGRQNDVQNLSDGLQAGDDQAAPRPGQPALDIFAGRGDRPGFIGLAEFIPVENRGIGNRIRASRHDECAFLAARDRACRTLKASESWYLLERRTCRRQDWSGASYGAIARAKG